MAKRCCREAFHAGPHIFADAVDDWPLLGECGRLEPASREEIRLAFDAASETSRPRVGGDDWLDTTEVD